MLCMLVLRASFSDDERADYHMTADAVQRTVGL
jgi:hypothetical protein